MLGMGYYPPSRRSDRHFLPRNCLDKARDCLTASVDFLSKPLDYMWRDPTLRLGLDWILIH